MKEPVYHPEYGKGFAVKKRYNGFEKLVNFSTGIKKWIKKNDLKPYNFVDHEDKNQNDSENKCEKPVDTGNVEKKENCVASKNDSGSMSEVIESSTSFVDNELNVQIGSESKDKKIFDASYVGNGITRVISHEDSEISVVDTTHTNIFNNVESSVQPESESKSDNFFAIDDEKISNTDIDTDNLKLNKNPEFIEKYINLGEDDKFLSRNIIESLRLGGVPQNNVQRFTYGRDKEANSFENWLNTDFGALMLTGEYGVGKTHLIEVLSTIALANNWAVAKIEIDPDETPFHKPNKMYEHIVRSFSYYQNNKLLGFEDFIEGLATSKLSNNKQKLMYHPYLGKIIRHWNDIDKRELLDWIKGSGDHIQTFPHLLSCQTASNIYSNILSGLGWAAKNMFGLNGVLIFFDESETLDPFWYTKYQFEKARNFLKGSIMMSNNDSRLIKDGNDDSYSGKLGLIYCRARNCSKYSYLWENDSGIKFVFSFVPEVIKCMENYSDIHGLFTEMEDIEIDNLSSDNLKHILGKLKHIYEDAYSFPVEHDIFSYLPDDKTRLFVKGAIEGFDLLRFNPEKSPEELLEKYDL